jgi:imidazolonepropionase-like amidohydrolase
LEGARKAIHRGPAAWFDMGSDIKVGERANISCWTADPLVTEASTTLTFVDGILSDNQADNTGRTGTPATAIPSIKFVLAAFDKPVGSNLPQSDAVLIRNATIWTSEAAGIITDSDILFANGKISAIGRKLSSPRNTTIIDGTGLHVTPGIIDCHSHTAVVGGVNEGSNIITAECRIVDVLDPDDINIYRQLAGGTTAANILHGSANAIGGQNAVVKWRWGSGASGLLIENAPQGIKFALGENPTRSNGSRQGRYPATRMGVERVIRSGFQRAHDYRQAQKLAKSGNGPAVATDYQLEAIAEILEASASFTAIHTKPMKF